MAFRVPNDLADALDALIEKETDLTKTEAVGVALHAFLSMGVDGRLNAILAHRARLHGGLPGKIRHASSAYPAPKK